MMCLIKRAHHFLYGGNKMGRFVNGMIAGSMAAAAGAYYLNKNKDKGRKMMREGKEVLNKAENCLDMAEQKMF